MESSASFYPKLNNPFSSPYQEFIHRSRYARWIEGEKRRENWDETVARLVDYYRNAIKLTDEECIKIYSSIHQLETLPSMRALMTAGPALDRCHVPAYNCAYLTVDSPRSFDEAMYLPRS